MVPLTVFTPTFNRSDLLQRCYESMQRQTCKDFIWMIIDDGSSDNTREKVCTWQEETQGFSIEYVYKENGGLYTAYNEAIARIKTELCVCIDSDDYMPDDAVEKILRFWEEYGSSRYAGIVGLDYDTEGNVLGDPFPTQKSINLIDLLTGKSGIRNADRTNVVRTELYRKYAPMPSFGGEKNFNPHYMHIQISQEYDFLILNENLRYVEYQSDGMTKRIYGQYKNSPRSFAQTRKLYLSLPNTPLKFRLKQSIHLVSSYALLGNCLRAVKESPRKMETLLMLPFGMALSLWIRIKTKENT